MLAIFIVNKDGIRKAEDVEINARQQKGATKKYYMKKWKNTSNGPPSGEEMC
jgi:hypothetical protein